MLTLGRTFIHPMTGHSFLPEGRGEVLEPCGVKGAGSHSGQDGGSSLDLITELKSNQRRSDQN